MTGVTLGTCFNCKKQEDWAKVKRPFTSNRICKLPWLSLQLGRELPSRAGKRHSAGRSWRNKEKEVMDLT
uniref:Uncharacterized protein n=1 Tax=Rhinopithecus roxellana TaxID=61622 RepID=A0A2K6RQC0_RHIRO